jgi:ABC-type Na+ efflux pump permease subunit
MLVIANREYQAAVRTKTFLISLVIMPVLMGGSVVLQVLLKDVVDTREKRFAVVDRTGRLFGRIAAAAGQYNEKDIFDPQTHKQVKPAFAVERVEPAAAVNEQRLALSERVRQGELFGFLEIGP